MSKTRIKKEEAIWLNEQLNGVAHHLFGKKQAYVVVFVEDEDIQFVTNASPGDLPQLPSILREAASMIEGVAPSVHEHVDHES